MQISASNVQEYMDQIPEERKDAFRKIRQVILDNLPEGFAEEMSYGMPGFVVPHSIYPAGYHCKPEEPLPFISLASQKNFIALYHMGIYSDENLLNWFREEYAKTCRTKLDMGKSCIRLKKMDDIPFGLIGELATKITVSQWIEIYESSVKK
ncbi:DUF1801 domain-containing protein [Spirochaeta isovalerica]|uniref:Uncharacterized protein YdhG (YjbR/CyaY superfamily) n=1 Tax=Spirochaeta isovalerica TaxID=150 RepID=A0A841RBW9_9SPIO|nr:DUF1801 domain-containing protein [Spirochaeta isovalerica]MBB6480168.1 uncharacterized protein YdhG (YjbR/CyaY superfamily) [Spirochaeta isovalerica]